MIAAWMFVVTNNKADTIANDKTYFFIVSYNLF